MPSRHDEHKEKIRRILQERERILQECRRTLDLQLHAIEQKKHVLAEELQLQDLELRGYLNDNLPPDRQLSMPYGNMNQTEYILRYDPRTPIPVTDNYVEEVSDNSVEERRPRTPIPSPVISSSPQRTPTRRRLSFGTPRTPSAQRVSFGLQPMETNFRWGNFVTIEEERVRKSHEEQNRRKNQRQQAIVQEREKRISVRDRMRQAISQTRGGKQQIAENFLKDLKKKPTSTNFNDKINHRKEFLNTMTHRYVEYSGKVTFVIIDNDRLGVAKQYLIEGSSELKEYRDQLLAIYLENNGNKSSESSDNLKKAFGNLPDLEIEGATVIDFKIIFVTKCQESTQWMPKNWSTYDGDLYELLTMKMKPEELKHTVVWADYCGCLMTGTGYSSGNANSGINYVAPIEYFELLSQCDLVCLTWYTSYRRGTANINQRNKDIIDKFVENVFNYSHTRRMACGVLKKGITREQIQTFKKLGEK